MFKAILILALITLHLNAGFYEEKFKPATQDCKVICEKCGFYVWQTEDYFKKLKASNENEDDFYIAMDDWVHYLYVTEKHLEVNGIGEKFYSSFVKTIEKCPTLFFGDYPLEVGKIDSPFIFILYQKGKKPYVIQDIVMSEDEINAYFNLTNPKYYKRGK